MWLGIDIGTSGVKAVIVDDAGSIVDQATAPLGVSRSKPLWTEQSPDDWWQAVQTAVCSIPARVRGQVQGIGLSGQMHGAVLLDASDQVLRPAILWNDGRSQDECAELQARVPNLHDIAGNLAMPGFTAPKLLWVRRHEPDIFARVSKVLLPKDYVRLILTGDHASDMSDSAGTLWLDVARRAWSRDVLDACGLDERQMPTLYEGSAPTGTLRPAAAEALGLPIVPVAGGGGDNAVGAVGVGVTEPGDAFLSLGTSGVIFAVSNGYASNPAQAVHAFCHALPGRWHQMSVILSAASCLDWVTKLTGYAGVPAAVAAAEAADSAQVPIFLPYLSGERTPHNDPKASGVFVGLRHDTDRGALVRSVLEGVAFALADGAKALRAAGTSIEALTVIGGGARSTFWGRILSAALEARLDYVSGGDVGPALGAAKLARMAVTSEPIEAVCPQPPVEKSVHPDPDISDEICARRERFRALYPALKDEFR